ncbi:hypothetical protein EJK80_09455 [Corynebacterium phoceense]|uniref:DUF4190 domain-containing protein n=1 Tax=Corynebacterium phoceense TaxID=1686286 RepID=A0A540R5F2_9CORY|nr:hypothetical protein [Corynebacterium phoceense]TQE42969.1 hypothetical protein EJK80_09455 [Corynebacterium phoceense]
MTTPNNPYGDSASNSGFGANGAGDGAANGATSSNGSTNPGAGAGQGLPNYGSSDANPTGTSNPAEGTGSTAYGAGAGAGADYGTGAGAGYTGYGAAGTPGATGTPGYGQGYQGAGDWGAAAAQKSKLAPWALGVGIIALLSCLFIIPPVVLGPIGIILAIVALVMARKLPKEARRTWMSVTGLVLSVLSLLFVVVLAVFSVGVFQSANLDECMKLTDPAEQQKCIENNVNSSFGQ